MGVLWTILSGCPMARLPGHLGIFSQGTQTGLVQVWISTMTSIVAGSQSVLRARRRSGGSFWDLRPFWTSFRSQSCEVTGNSDHLGKIGVGLMLRREH